MTLVVQSRGRVAIHSGSCKQTYASLHRWPLVSVWRFQSSHVMGTTDALALDSECLFEAPPSVLPAVIFIHGIFSLVALSEIHPSAAQPNSPPPSFRQQTCLLAVTADMSPVGHSRHVCRVTQQTRLRCDTEDTSAVSHSRHVCCVAQQTWLLCDIADMSAV